jgi:hypothetical protein
MHICCDRYWFPFYTFFLLILLDIALMPSHRQMERELQQNKEAFGIIVEYFVDAEFARAC